VRGRPTPQPDHSDSSSSSSSSSSSGRVGCAFLAHAHKEAIVGEARAQHQWKRRVCVCVCGGGAALACVRGRPTFLTCQRSIAWRSLMPPPALAPHPRPHQHQQPRTGGSPAVRHVKPAPSGGSSAATSAAVLAVAHVRRMGVSKHHSTHRHAHQTLDSVGLLRVGGCS
jgi:hypothetical protein